MATRQDLQKMVVETQMGESAVWVEIDDLGPVTQLMLSHPQVSGIKVAVSLSKLSVPAATVAQVKKKKKPVVTAIKKARGVAESRQCNVKGCGFVVPRGKGRHRRISLAAHYRLKHLGMSRAMHEVRRNLKVPTPIPDDVRDAS